MLFFATQFFGFAHRPPAVQSAIAPRYRASSVMQADARHQQILDLLMRRGYAGIEELAAGFDVTPQTIRRDLQDLADRGLLRRHHGGASMMSSTVNTDYAKRHVENAAEKARIGAVAADLITPGSSVFLTPGTTVEAAATAIADSGLNGLRVITNSTVAAQILSRNPKIVIHVTGGTWQSNNHSLSGPTAAEIADRYRCDFMLTGIGAIDADGWLVEFRDEETVVARAMLANARRRILMADYSKFSRVATCKLARLGDITTLITDRPPPPKMRRTIKDSGCEVVIAPER